MDADEVSLLRKEVHGLRMDFKDLAARLGEVIELRARHENLEFRINQQETRLNRQSEKLDTLSGSSAEHSSKIEYSVHWVQWIIASALSGGMGLLVILVKG